MSYQKDSREDAFALGQRLEQTGLVTWGFQRDLRYGDDWKVVIDNAIIGSSVVIVIVTLAALDSPYVTYEWSFALGRQKRVVPLMLEHPDPTNKNHPKMHPRLQVYQWADTKADDFSWDHFVAEIFRLAREHEKPAAVDNAERELTSTNAEIRNNAVKSMEVYDHPSALNLLISALDSGYADVVAFAGLAIARRTTFTAPEALRGLDKALDDKQLNKWALDALQEYNSAGAAEVLGRFAERCKDFQVTELAERLVRMTHPSVLPVLQRIAVRKGGISVGLIEALGKHRDKRALPDLLDIWDRLSPKQSYIPARSNIIKAIIEIGGPEGAAALSELIARIIPIMDQNPGYLQLISEALDGILSAPTIEIRPLLTELKSNKQLRQWWPKIETVIRQFD